MFIITVLDVTALTVSIIDAFNDELEAQDHYLNTVERLMRGEDLADEPTLAVGPGPSNVYETIIISKTIAHIYKLTEGWTKTYKQLVKIIELHSKPDFTITDSRPMY